MLCLECNAALGALRDDPEEILRAIRLLGEPMMEFRWCPACQAHKPATEFVRNRANKSGYHGYCKPCHRGKVYASIEKHHGTKRDFHLKRRYGINSADVTALVEEQGNACPVCRAKDPSHVDHCHTTGKVRGILCFNCNRALGYLKDDERDLFHLLDYIEEWKGAPLSDLAETT